MFNRQEKGFVQELSEWQIIWKQRIVKKVEKALKSELRRREVEAMDKIAEDLEDTARRHNSRILYWHVNKLRRSSQFGLVPVKDRSEATISDKEKR